MPNKKREHNYTLPIKLFLPCRKASLCRDLGLSCVSIDLLAVWHEHGLQQALQRLPQRPAAVFSEQWQGLAPCHRRVCPSNHWLSVLHRKFNLHLGKIPELEADHCLPSTRHHVRIVIWLHGRTSFRFLSSNLKIIVIPLGNAVTFSWWLCTECARKKSVRCFGLWLFFYVMRSSESLSRLNFSAPQPREGCPSDFISKLL